jgi:hypothetical protein
VWPVLSGVVMGGLAFVVGFGIVLLSPDGIDWANAARVGGIAGFVTLPVVTVSVFWYAAANWAGPGALEKARRTVIHEREPAKVEHRWTRINQRGKQSTHTPPSVTVKRDPAWRRWFGKAQTTYAADVEPLAPQADDWVMEAYDVVCTLWNEDLTRTTFQRHWPSGGTGMYYKYVAGKNGVRGWFQQWGVIERKDGRGAMRFRFSLDRVLQADDDLWRYAQQQGALSPALSVR